MGGSTAASSSPPKASTAHALKPQAKQPHLRRLADFAACILLHGTPALAQHTEPGTSKERQPARKSDAEGKSVSVRVILCGRRLIQTQKKQKKIHKNNTTHTI